MQIPAYCQGCGTIFGFSVIEGNVAGITIGKLSLRDVTMPCPKCGGTAHVVDGVFSLANNALTLIQGSNLTIVVVQQFAELLEKAQKEGVPIDEVESIAESLDPALGDAIRSIKNSPNFLWMAMFVVLLLALKECHFDVKADANQLIYQAMHNGEMFVPDDMGSPSSEHFQTNVLVQPDPNNVEQQQRGGAPHLTNQHSDHKSSSSSGRKEPAK